MNYGTSCHAPAAQALRRSLVVLALLIQQPVIQYGISACDELHNNIQC